MWTLLLLLVYASPNVLCAPTESSSSTVRCYDCHYDPTALEQKDDGSYSSTGTGGFPRCALMNQEDPDFLNKYGCTKGKCFIRRDPNGQVFRGCADPWNLPWGVDTDNSCKRQHDKSVWWFCEGELCNDGRIDDDKRCEDLPKLKRKEREKLQSKEEHRYEPREQNVYQPTYYGEDKTEEVYEEPSASISVTVTNYGDASEPDSTPVSAYDAINDVSPHAETVYDFQEDKGSDIYNVDSTSVGYENNEADIFYSRLQGRYVNYGNEGPAHYYTDSELSHNADVNFNTYDYVLPDDYGRPTPTNAVEEYVEPVSEGYYPDVLEPEPNESYGSYEEYYPDPEEVEYEEAEYKGEEIPLDGVGYPGEDGAYFSYDSPTPTPDEPIETQNYDKPIPENWYEREVDELSSSNLPYGWHPYPWFHGYTYSHSPDGQNKGADEVSWNGEPYTPEEPSPKKSHPAPKKSSYEPSKKSHPPPKKSSYEPPKKSHPPPKKSGYIPPKKSQPPPKKSSYVPPKKSHPPPKKSSYEPPKKSHPQPKKSSYVPPKKSHPPPKKSSYVPPKKSQPPSKKSSYESPKKSHPQPKKSSYVPPKKSHPPPKKSSYEPPKKSHQPPKKSSYEPPKKSHPPPKKSGYIPPKKSHPPSKKSSYEPPKKSHPPPKKSSYEPPKKSHPPPKKSYQPPPKKSYVPTKKSQPQPKGKKQSTEIADSSKKVFEPENSQSRDQNTVYSLGDNLQVRDSTLIHLDGEQQDGVNAAYIEVSQDNVEYGKEFDDDIVYYDYETEPNADTGDDTENVGTGDLFDPNSITDDTAYYYEYSHKIYTPSENVKNMCDGTCGLYPHPDSNAKFVQCGPGVHYGQSCDCCHPYEHTCSDGTSFDAYIGVCSLGSDSSKEPASYKAVDYY